jgi:hypothetical protein
MTPSASSIWGRSHSPPPIPSSTRISQTLPQNKYQTKQKKNVYKPNKTKEKMYKPNKTKEKIEEPIWFFYCQANLSNNSVKQLPRQHR